MNENAIQDLIGRYLTAWNEPCAKSRGALMEELCTEDVRYVDPLMDVTGPAALSATISLTQAQFPGMTFRLGAVDAHHDIARFTWHLVPEDGNGDGSGSGSGDGSGSGEVLTGFNVVAVAADGRIRQVHGFLDETP
ncbi:nuclear transport factor 2 family protein [Actinomadura barringtoniae]|uniref:Nuclear transport factor 2 family protein n=1 Tax=Actinomadura barringtoniae TaxID=1427535 RepID=A0A939P6M4_9ACTN|nr:nuclear transport factor 2 family protein [Actinomadura barringtoniae]MBO2446405.1 nuclear transport factor 2 family protein [Actinomadura barringtoniae]